MYDFHETLKPNSHYLLNYVIISKLDGYHITKSRFTKLTFIKPNEAAIPITIVDLTSSSVRLIKY